jgi:hypothetical protein
MRTVKDAEPTLIHKCLTSLRFELMQVKTGLCHILSDFEVAPYKETPLHTVFDKKAFILIMDERYRCLSNGHSSEITFIKDALT